MIASLIGFVTSKTGMYVVGGIATVGLLLGVRSHFIHQGQLEGQQTATDTMTAQRDKERQQDRDQLAEIVKQANSTIAAAQAQLAEASQREQAASQAIRALAVQRTQAQATVNGLKDSDLHDFIVGPKGLALRPSTDRTPGYNPAEERALASCVSDYPLCKDTTDKQANQIASINDKVDALQKQQNAMQAKYDALATYTNTVERDYTDLYNSFPRKGNTFLRILTFGLAGKPKKLTAPDPKVLFPQRTAAAEAH